MCKYEATANKCEFEYKKYGKQQKSYIPNFNDYMFGMVIDSLLSCKIKKKYTDRVLTHSDYEYGYHDLAVIALFSKENASDFKESIQMIWRKSNEYGQGDSGNAELTIYPPNYEYIYCWKSLYDYSRQQLGEENATITKELLLNASSIVYKCSNGSVPPPYGYVFFITVSRNNVNVRLYWDDQNEESYNESSPISFDQYNKFVDCLSSQRIKRIAPLDPGVGFGDSAIWIYDNKDILFEGYERGGEKTLALGNGKLIDSFLSLVTDEMKSVIENPERKDGEDNIY